MNKSPMLYRIISSLFVILACFQPASGTLVGISGIEIDPPAPTVLDDIQITPYGWTGYALNTELVDYTFGISGTNIYVDSYFYFDSGDGYSLPVAGDWDVTADIGLLPADDYTAIARTWITYTIIPIYELDDTYSRSFVVTPEPATLILLSIGGLILRKSKK